MPTSYQTSTNHDYIYIDTNEDLVNYCESIQNTNILFIDTEFIREKTYAPVLCLIQVATEETLACIDPIAINNLEPFLDLMFNEAIVKVFHAARQDLEIFYNLRDTAPKNLFDTQIAATLLGHADQIGYGNLVNALIKVSLDKKYARTDWTQRPLSTEQLEYAINDVIYLREIYEIILNKLNNLGRLDWLTEDFNFLSSDSTFKVIPENMWQKIKGQNKLSGLQRAVLQDLAAWRETKAIHSNKPRKWILNEDVILSLAQHQPETTSSLAKIRGITDGIVKKSGPALIEIIKQAKQRPQESWPELKKFTRTNTQQDALIDCMMAMVRLCASKENIATTMLCSKKDLEKWLVSDESIALLSGWRYQIAGKQLTDFMDGNISIACNNKQLDFTIKS